MPDTFKIGGKPVDKTYVYVGVGIVLVAGVYYYRKNKASSAAQASVTAAGSTDIDPATGYPYGSAEDAAALNSQDNYQSPVAQGGYGYAGYAGGSGSGAFGQGAPGTFISNADWAQYVEGYEINTMGADAPTVGNVIGKYLTGQPLTSDNMISIVQSAIAIGGYPPVPGPNGNPPSYVTGSTTPTTPPTPVTTIPPKSSHAGAISNLQGTVSGTTAKITWNSVPKPANGYSYVMSEVTGAIFKKGQLTQFATSISFSGLKHGTTYNFGIQALPGGAGDNIHLTVK
jgi:hypothetical protein